MLRPAEKKNAMIMQKSEWKYQKSE